MCDVAGDKITLEPTSDLFSVGDNAIQIRIVDDTKTLVTFNANCYCENSVEFGDEAEEKEQTLIEQLLASQGKIQTGLNNEVEERKKQAKNLEDNKLDKTGDASDTTIDFTESLKRENIITGENARTMFGKIAKWFSDIKEAAFAKVANNLDTTEEGYVLDARQGKKIKEDIADLNSKMTETIKEIKLVSKTCNYNKANVNIENLKIECIKDGILCVNSKIKKDLFKETELTLGEVIDLIPTKTRPSCKMILDTLIKRRNFTKESNKIKELIPTKTSQLQNDSELLKKSTAIEEIDKRVGLNKLQIHDVIYGITGSPMQIFKHSIMSSDMNLDVFVKMKNTFNYPRYLRINSLDERGYSC